MMLLRILGILLAALAGILILLLLCILYLPIWLHFTGNDKELKLSVGIGPLRKSILPHKKKRRTEQKTAEKAKTKKKKPIESPDFDIEAILRILSQLAQRTKIRIFQVNILLGTSDAAQTGLLLGAFSAAAGMILPVIEENYCIKKYRVVIDADFDASRTIWDAELYFVFHIITAIRVLLNKENRKFLAELLLAVNMPQSAAHVEEEKT